MNIPSITSTRLKIQIALLAVLALALLPTIISAHGGEEHVVGTVTKVSDTSVTVKTTAGKIVEVGFDAKTLKMVTVFNTDPNGDFGAVWQAGASRR